MRILLVEDDHDTAAYVSRGLAEVGHVCDVLADGQDGLFQATREVYDVAVVDRMLPGLDGLRLVRALRAAGRKVPVLFLTAVGGVEDRVEGLEAGADDYLTKPFAFSELLARVNALARQPQAVATTTALRVADLELDLLARTARRGGTLINLLPKEFTLLEVLMRNEGRVVTRTMLLERVWDFNFDPKTSVVETHVSRLRAKIDRPFGQPLLHTVKSAGYVLRASSGPASPSHAPR
ncbi:response regulator [Rubellimicrobium rubrum]|uniref:Response regulator n=1 Tax=Rubellimicrobium rubrum TaxID=2585369 RepID=A0A5C4MZT8_9RHOB|nr:response regulator [Rubellimicrobium rubrum]TNC49445.1 response regulator [Rubellimicrobium rubrum]